VPTAPGSSPATTSGAPGANIGGSVEILTGFTGEDGARFESTIEPVGSATGIEITHVGINNQQEVITTRVQAGNPPDLALVSQPGLLISLAQDGKLVALDDVIDTGAAANGLVPGLTDMATIDGALYGVPYRLSLKSLVWYPPQAFTAKGYTVPETFEAFTGLVDQMRTAGDTPLCIAIESGGGTGWPATDWIEDLVLRTGGPDVYDRWASHELPFNSPEIRRAFDVFGELAFTEGNVPGGRQGIVSTLWSDGILPMFDDPVGCWMEKQGSFIANSLPESARPGENVSTFYLPAYAEGGYAGRPVEVAGEMLVMFNDTPAARQVMASLATSAAGEPWARQGGFLSPWQAFDSGLYPDVLSQSAAETLSGATVARFDASDLMPPAVGAGSFFTELTSWINGDTALDETLQALDDSWPQ
jgi:alpha-glucoside transport system substrate-binding protein